ncbi:MAG TPA: branched-chain amino acid ABC transporter permease [Marmoricola sp.]|jgi:branched-chain amino acid transport system permease protein|nr:branched-chain amino acid ABC transporter permease [Marmoricola sp.]
MTTPSLMVPPTRRSPLQGVGEWWDDKVDRYNAQPIFLKAIWVFVALVLVYALPLLRPPGITTNQIDFGGVMFDCAAFALVALGLNIVIGYAGLLDLGYVGFYATGAYVTGVLTSYHWHWPYFLSLPLAIIVTMITGVILGAPTLRVRGDYLAIVTLGFGEIIQKVVNNTGWLGASAGIKDIAHPPTIGTPPTPPYHQGGAFAIPHLQWDGLIPSLDHEHETHFLVFGALDAIPYYWLIVTILILVFLGDRLIKASRVGRAWEATREDEDAAELMGVNTFKYKLLAFALGAAIGGLSGSLYASGQGGYINPQAFMLIYSMLYVAAVIVGGSGNRWGAILGGVIVAYLPDRFRSLGDYRYFIFGLALMTLAIWRPQGLLPPRRARRARAAAADIDALEEGDNATAVSDV